MKLQKQLKIAKEAARRAGEIQLKYFGTSLKRDFKSEKDFATEVDYLCEQEIMTIISKAFPEDGFLGEEDGVTEGSSQYVWVIDPLDGTVNYAHGFPYFCSIISLWDKNSQEVVLGLVHEPVVEKTYWAIKGEGAFCNDEQISVSVHSELSECFITLGSFDIDPKKQKNQYNKYQCLHDSIYKFLRARVTGSAGVDLAFVASGVTDVHVVYGTKPWDHLGPSLIITEAGGKCSDRDLKQIGFESRGIIATNGVIYDQVIGLMCP